MLLTQPLRLIQLTGPEWATEGLLISDATAQSLLCYTHGDVLLDYFVKVVRHRNDIAFLHEHLELLAERLRDVCLDLSRALLASHAQKDVSPDAGIVIRQSGTVDSLHGDGGFLYDLLGLLWAGASFHPPPRINRARFDAKLFGEPCNSHLFYVVR